MNKRTRALGIAIAVKMAVAKREEMREYFKDYLQARYPKIICTLQRRFKNA